MSIIKVVFFFVLIVYKTECAKILVVYPVPSFSHYTLGIVLVEELARRGHEVTFVTPFPNKTHIPNGREISVENVIEYSEGRKKLLFGNNQKSVLSRMTDFVEMGIEMTRLTLTAEPLQQLLKSSEKFDLVLVEYFSNDAVFGLASHFRAPLIVSSGVSPALVGHLWGDPAPSSYVPNLLTSFTKHMNFWQRLVNLVFNIAWQLVHQILVLPKQRQIFKDIFQSDLELDDVLYNGSLLLANSHISIGDALAHQPSVIEIGGYHVKSPKSLPADLQKFLDDAKDGVVLFSMGSILKSADLQPEVQTSLLKAFGKLKQKVLWKFEKDLPNTPKNVKVLQWIPQNDVLAHPNVRAFISHGGLLSTIEAVYHGVPVIGIPVFGDQISNIAAGVDRGYALSVPLKELTEERLSRALNEILNNPKYKNEIKRRSNIMKDRPLKPLDQAMYWIEYVIRHQGAPQLKSAAMDLKWYQREMIDILTFLALVVIVILTVSYILLRLILKFLFKSRPKVTKSKKNR